MADALFEIRGPTEVQVPGTVLGAWNLAPGKGASFSGGDAFDPDTPVWSVSLNAQTANANLQAADFQLRVTREALDEATKRLNEFIAGAGPGGSFGIGDDETREPETELRDYVNELAGGAAADFGILDFVGLDTNGLIQRFQEFLAELQRLLADPLVVETRDRDVDEIVAMTAMGWTGHSHTVIVEDEEKNLRAEHGKSLALALGQRTLMFQIAALAAEGAVRLAIVIAMPANALWMMPGIYQYITRVMDEYFKIRERLNA